MFLDTEELQSEITKLKNSILNSITNKDTSDAAVVKTDITNVKSSNDEIDKKIKDINIKIAKLLGDVKEINTKSDRIPIIETNFNNANTQLIEKDEDFTREIQKVRIISSGNFDYFEKK